MGLYISMLYMHLSPRVDTGGSVEDVAEIRYNIIISCISYNIIWTR